MKNRNRKIARLCMATLLAAGTILGGCGKPTDEKMDSGKSENAAEKIIMMLGSNK